VTDSAEVPTILHDTLTIIDANDAACQLFRIDKQDLIDRDLLGGVADDSMRGLIKMRLKMIRELGELHAQHIPFMRHDNTIFWAEVQTTLTADGLYKTTLRYLYEY
jgi:hypothetical protein